MGGFMGGMVDGWMSERVDVNCRAECCVCEVMH